MKSIIRSVAVKIGSCTAVPMLGDYPLRAGNFFTLKMYDGEWAWVQNISAEDFEEICKRKKLYSVSVLYLPEHKKCFIIDTRIPWDWYRYYEKIDSSVPLLVSYTGADEDTDPIITCPYMPEFITIDHGITQEDYYDENENSYQLKMEFSFKNEN